MFHMNKLILAAVLIAFTCNQLGYGHAHGGGHGKGGHGQHMQKIKKCMNETRDLISECCPVPKDDSMKENEECKHHLEGVENKEGKEKWQAMKCHTECIFKSGGLLVDGKLADRQKMKESFTDYLNKNGGEDFVQVTETATDYCMDKIDAGIAKWKAMKEKWTTTTGNPNEEQKEKKKEHCNMLPASLIGCVRGYIARNCPESKWQNNEECEAKKTSATPMDECTKH